MKIEKKYSCLAGKRIAFHTLGCKVNAYETEAMQQSLETHGCIIVPFEEKEQPVDAYIINTCSVTNIADKKSRQMLRRARSKNPDALVVAAGCYAQLSGQELLAQGIADMLVGTNQKKELDGLLAAHFAADSERRSAVADMRPPVAYEEQFISRVENHTRAFMKIQEGCNQFCSYCIIPYARGRIRSRALEAILSEARLLAAGGVREIVLTGIHLSSYGLDLYGEVRLLDVIHALDKVEGITRIRLSSLEPRVVTEAFAKELASVQKVCPHFHLSLQSGSDTVLKRMNRHYTSGEYFRSCEYLRSAYAHPAITTDVIVGFPGETEAEFEETRSFCQAVNFYEMHVFPYSRRAGTAADRMDGQLPEQVKKERSAVLLAEGRRMSEQFRSYYIQEQLPCEILIEEEIEYGHHRYAAGYTREYIRAAVELPQSGICSGAVAAAYLKKRLMSGKDEIILAEPVKL